ncbi:uncharacterized protein MYCGRDRAFT_92085 [Zymoseptoria tritici IPO323]|uniref:Uncharacterized protein n=1 Tax=Zymoseptoria tritici (strain CBS 115943 / IPO323) TaxID=336722 RepID=F9X6H7_ZYMTI|nr:uncharacterized protein MYCGRDRAFT_92085 [Zymoseptoria tritici IPO323]EGP89044.1 hypothetical protein MYCGRDRAFT_92085 [Zymoseptoria tritici IPO323]
MIMLFAMPRRPSCQYDNTAFEARCTSAYGVACMTRKTAHRNVRLPPTHSSRRRMNVGYAGLVGSLLPCYTTYCSVAFGPLPSIAAIATYPVLQSKRQTLQVGGGLSK